MVITASKISIEMFLSGRGQRINILAWCRAVAAFIAEPGAAPDRGRYIGFARCTRLSERPRQVSLVVRHHGFGIQEWASRRGHHGVEIIYRNVSCVGGVGAFASWRRAGQLQHSSPNQALHLTGAAILVSRGGHVCRGGPGR